MLTIDKLQVKYGKQTALTITSPLTIRSNDRIGVIGSNGAGKTTLLKTLLGLLPYEGRIDTRLRPEDISVHMQQNNYVTTMPVKHIMSAILNTNIKTNKKLQELIDFFDFKESMNKKFSALSGGQKQRFTVIMVLFQDAPLTFFDEVTSGLDFETRQKLMNKIREWYHNKDASIVLVSHYYDELERLANKLLILDKGKVVAFGQTEELFAQYCGRAVIMIPNNEKNRALTVSFPKIQSPAHLIALTCGSEEEETKLTSLFIQENIDYKRSSNDIEITYINALAKKGGDVQ